MDNMVAEATAPEIAPKKQGVLGKFAYTAFMLIVNAGIFALVLVLFFREKVESVLIIGIILMLIYALICFKVKKGYRPLMTWWEILGLIYSGWWAYLLVRG